MPAGHFFARPGVLGVVALLLAVGSAAGQNAAPSLPFQVRTQGSFPLQYMETLRGPVRAGRYTGAPYSSLMAVREFQPGLTAVAFVEAGQAPLGQFRDNDNTFTSYGANVVKRWEMFSTGVSLERTHYYAGTFGPTTNIANDANLFARTVWQPNANLQFRPGMSVSIRFNDSFGAQRYGVGGSVEIQHRLVGSWWAIAIPRLRYSEYAGSEAGRRDTTGSIVAGVKYDFNESISARIIAGYENRMSNIASRERERFIAGISLDYEFAFGRLR